MSENYTVLDNLELVGKLRLSGQKKSIAKTAKADAAAAAGTAPTKAEFDAVVELLNDLKAKYNALAEAITE